MILHQDCVTWITHRTLSKCPWLGLISREVALGWRHIHSTVKTIGPIRNRQALSGKEHGPKTVVWVSWNHTRFHKGASSLYIAESQQHIVSSCVSHNKLPTNVVALSNRNLVSSGDQKFKIMVLVGPLFFQRVWGRILPWLSQFLVAVGIPGLIAASLQSLFSSRTLVIGFRAHTDHPGWSTHLEILNLIASVKTIFPNKVTFTSYRD